MDRNDSDAPAAMIWLPDGDTASGWVQWRVERKERDKRIGFRLEADRCDGGKGKKGRKGR